LPRIVGLSARAYPTALPSLFTVWQKADAPSSNQSGPEAFQRVSHAAQADCCLQMLFSVVATFCGDWARTLRWSRRLPKTGDVPRKILCAHLAPLLKKLHKANITECLQVRSRSPHKRGTLGASLAAKSPHRRCNGGSDRFPQDTEKGEGHARTAWLLLWEQHHRRHRSLPI
jgi:hypothetical protein